MSRRLAIPDPHPKWPLRVTSVSLCPAFLGGARGARWPHFGEGGERARGRGGASFFILMSHSTEQEQEEE